MQSRALMLSGPEGENSLEVYTLAFSILLILLLVACNHAGPCADGADNDGDGQIDTGDPSCVHGNDEGDGAEAACYDLRDNDEDGLVDLDDPGCNGPTDDDETDVLLADCADGIDNDGDGLTDYPNDPGCGLSLENDEEDSCPSGEQCPLCANGVDDDGDGDTDYPTDPGCSSAADTDELNFDPTICGPTVELAALPTSGAVTGTFASEATNGLISPSCGGDGAETAYVLSLATPAAVVINADFPETAADTVIYLREECREPDTEISCNDDSGEMRASRLAIPYLEAGDYYLIIDSRATQPGDFKVEVSTYLPEGASCDVGGNSCAPHLQCDGGDAVGTCGLPPSGPTCNDNGTMRPIVKPSADDLALAEYMANPTQVSDSLGEWLEIRVDADIDLNGLSIGRSESDTGPGPALFTFEGDNCVPASADTSLLFARSTDAAVNGGLPAVDHVISFGIVNANDGLFLAIDGDVFDEVLYSSVPSGASESRDPSSGEFCNGSLEYGDGDLGTPAGPNPSCP